jgi:hypothetical protein
MANAKPYYTTNDLIESVKRRISYPLSQNTFQYSDIVAFLNEELQLSAVPAVKIEHEEYFVYKKTVPLVNGISRYEIPDRAIGMALRDVKYSDMNGNFYDMMRIAPDDKAFFQQSNGSNQTVSKFYVEGNEIVLTPLVQAGASGKLNFFFYLRPNNLVRNDRACIIQNYLKDITFDITDLEPGDKFNILTGVQSPTPAETIFTAVSGVPGANEFQIGASDVITATNFIAAVNAAAITNVTATNVSVGTIGKARISYKDIAVEFQALKGTGNTNPIGTTFDDVNIYINFNQLPSTYTDPETDITTSLYVAGTSYVDFLQTNPGHRTYTYDVLLVSANGTIGAFKADDLKTYANNSSGGELTYLNIKIGDYICLQNECIIPQIPPELHNALAERAASRVLMAIGDVQGYQISQAKLAEMNKMQETLIGSRIESSVPKVFNRYSLLRLGKSRFRRRY